MWRLHKGGMSLGTEQPLEMSDLGVVWKEQAGAKPRRDDRQGCAGPT